MAAEEEAATAALNVVVPSVEIMMERMTEQQMSEKKKAMLSKQANGKAIFPHTRHTDKS